VSSTRFPTEHHAFTLRKRGERAVRAIDFSCPFLLDVPSRYGRSLPRSNSRPCCRPRECDLPSQWPHFCLFVQCVLVWPYLWHLKHWMMRHFGSKRSTIFRSYAIATPSFIRWFACSALSTSTTSGAYSLWIVRLASAFRPLSCAGVSWRFQFVCAPRILPMRWVGSPPPSPRDQDWQCSFLYCRTPCDTPCCWNGKSNARDSARSSGVGSTWICLQWSFLGSAHPRNCWFLRP